MFISTKLRKLRNEKGYTLDYVSSVTGINKSMLSKYENDASDPSCKTLEKLADFYNISMDELFLRDAFVIHEGEDNYIRTSEEFIKVIEVLKERKIIKKQLNGVKVLGNGELTKKLTVKANRFSTKAVTKIENIGGKAEVI